MEAFTEHSATIDKFFKPVSNAIDVSKETSPTYSGKRDGKLAKTLDYCKDTEVILGDKFMPHLVSKKKKIKRKRLSVDNIVPKKPKYTKCSDESNGKGDGTYNNDCIIIDEPEAMSFDEFMNKGNHQTQPQNNSMIRKSMHSRSKKNLLLKRESRKTSLLRKKATAMSCSAFNSKRKQLRFRKSDSSQPQLIDKKVDDNSRKKISTNSKQVKLKKGESKTKKKERKSSSDGVVYVAEVKKATHSHLIPAVCRSPMKPRKSVPTLPPLKNECILWTEKYEPKSSVEVIGNLSAVTKLHDWLGEWKKRVEKEKQLLLVTTKKTKSSNRDNDSSGSDFEDHLSNDGNREEDTLATTAVIIGPTGCGKTATVYACADELNFKVFELNASSQRSSKQVLSQLHEATQSHQVSKSKLMFGSSKGKDGSAKKSLPKAFSKFSPKSNDLKSSRGSQFHGDKLNESAVTSGRASLILFEEVEVLFEEDKFFWSAVQTIMAETKRPVVLTTTDPSILNNLEGKYEKIVFKRPSTAQIESCLKQIGEKEHIDFGEKFHVNSRHATEAFGRDNRKCIHALHFWSDTYSQSVNVNHCDGDLNITNDIVSLDDSIVSISSQTDTDIKQEASLFQKSKRNKKRGRRRSKRNNFEPNEGKIWNPAQELIDKIDAHKQKKCLKGGFFERISGIDSIIQQQLKDHSHKSSDNQYLSEHCNFQDILCYLSLIKGKFRLRLVEEVLSHLYVFSFVQVIPLNWKRFLPGLYNTEEFTRVGKMQLPIHSSIFTFNSEMEFTPKSNFQALVEGIPEYKPQVPLDFLIEEDSMDVCYSGNSSPAHNINVFPKTSLIQSSPDKLYPTKYSNFTSSSIMEELSRMADACCLSDRIHSVFMRKSDMTNLGTFDPTVCRIQDGLLDTSGVRSQITYKMTDTIAQLQASIQARSISYSRDQLSSISGFSNDIPNLEIHLKLPNEEKVKKSNHFLCHSIQSQLCGGVLTSRDSFRMDYLPALRSICRTEERRKTLKIKRRFLHYLSSIQVHPKSFELIRLQNEFEVKPISNLST